MLIQQFKRIVPERWKRVRLGPVEWIAGALATLLVCWLHFLFMRSAGAIWRDEVVSVNVAGQPSLGQLWESLRFESFPGLFHLILRGWMLAFGGADHALRLLGSLVGLGIAIAFWINGRLLHYRVPFVSLALLGFSPLVIRTTDSLRAYGLGILCIVLTAGLVWRVVESPSFYRVCLAATLAILSVQSLYQNSFLLFAVCLGAIVVTLLAHNWRGFAAIMGIGLVSLLSLAVNIPAILRLREISELMPRGVSLEHLFAVFAAALTDGGDFMFWIWAALVLGGLIVALRLPGTAGAVSDRGRELAVFSGVTIVAAGLGFFVWLKVLGLRSEPWYFVPLLAILGLSLDAIFGTLPRSRNWEAARIVFFITFSLLLFFRAIPGARMRQTNIDLISLELERNAGKDDLIVVNPWYFGATFSRYFHGQTEWLTLPPLKDQTLQRLDLFREQMMAPDPIGPVMQKIENVLRAGHQVWLVGDLPFHQPGETPPQILPVPADQPARDYDRYAYIWAVQVAYFVQIHRESMTKVLITTDQQINPYESPALLVVAGWRSAPP